MRYNTLTWITAFFCLTLAACGTEATLTYTATFDTTEASKVMYLTQAIERVMVRKLASFGIEKPRVISLPDGDHAATVTFADADTKETQEVVEKMTTERLTFDMRIEKVAITDPKNTDPANWIATTLTGSSLSWVQVIGDPSNGNISIDLAFTESGAKILQTIFKENKGKSIGIFVRDLLVSKLLIEKELTENHVRISGVPSAKIAEVFADDVNVGLHTTFSKKN